MEVVFCFRIVVRLSYNYYKNKITICSITLLNVGLVINYKLCKLHFVYLKYKNIFVGVLRAFYKIRNTTGSFYLRECHDYSNF